MELTFPVQPSRVSIRAVNSFIPGWSNHLIVADVVGTQLVLSSERTENLSNVGLLLLRSATFRILFVRRPLASRMTV